MQRIPWLLAAVVVLRTAPARADIGGDIPLDGFRPALDARGFVTIDGGDVLAPGEPSFGLVTTWSRGLLDLDGDGASYRVEDVVSPTLVAAIGIPSPLRGLGLELAGALPFGVISADRGPDQVGEDGDLAAQGVGDLALHLKVRVLERARWMLGFAIGGSLPTATANSWLGHGRATGGGRAIAEWRDGRWRAAANLGLRLRAGGDAEFRDETSTMLPPTGATLSLGPAIPAGVATSYALSPGRFEVIGELGGQLPLRGDYRPIEAGLSFRVRLAEASHFTVGAGSGLGATAGSPELRAFAAIVFEPRAARVERVIVDDPPPSPEAPRPGDRDDDTIIDTLDACPDDREDWDEHEDEDGCPDLDNDHDTILDVEDLCIDEPEDFDGDADDDGCPDRDRVAIGEGELEVFEDIHFEFDSAVIQERSHDILRVIARTLLGNPDLKLIEIGGHTDDRGSAKYNRDLSQRRADAVRTFLEDEGVTRSRLRAKGYGEDVPKIEGRGEEAWQANRRVEFLILKRAR
jgi:outer membrane protein OmpA-like peptidoglycan-associated protein